MITELTADQVFIFGSNATGFHGAGSAGYACRGTAENSWRHDVWFLNAMRSPAGSPARIGKWAVYGKARGPQLGREGKSYAIQTIERPGAKRSTPLEEIQQQIVQLCTFARQRTHLRFMMTPIGCGLSGYSPSEMKACMTAAFEEAGGRPDNVVVPEGMYDRVTWQHT